MSEVNYSELLKDSSYSQYFSYLNDKYFELNAPKLRIFKLDKTVTKIHDLYGFEESSRIYLPLFEIRGIYKTNPWELIMDSSSIAEKEDNITFVVNLDKMVSTIRELKIRHVAEVMVTYTNPAPYKIPGIKKENNVITLYVNEVVVGTIDLTVYRSIKNVAIQINNVQDFSVTYDVNDDINNIEDFEYKTFKNQTLLIYSIDHTYDNCTDVIEMGDLILTDKWRLYEVKFAKPGGDFGWNWATYEMQANLIELDVADGLPGEYKKLIEQHQYGLPKVRKE
jgi:hypothetical protein